MTYISHSSLGPSVYAQIFHVSLIALSVNALHVWALRWHIERDGISYVDIAWAYARGDWSHTINAYWNPLFS